MDMEEEGEEKNSDAVIGEGHNDRATNTTILQMLKLRDLIVMNNNRQSLSQMRLHL